MLNESTSPHKVRAMLENSRQNSPIPNQKASEILRDTPDSTQYNRENKESMPTTQSKAEGEQSQRLMNKSVAHVPFKRQLTDKYAAEKLRCNRQKLGAGGSRKGSNEQKHGFQSDFSQKAVA